MCPLLIDVGILNFKSFINKVYRVAHILYGVATFGQLIYKQILRKRTDVFDGYNY